MSKEAVGLIHGFRSGLEEKHAAQIKAAGLPVLYESAKVYFVQPERARTYLLDFPFPNGIVVESKGRFLTEDRQKHKLVKAQYPDLDIRFVFSNANARLTKASKTTYAAWCEKYGFKWAHRSIPAEWFAEPPCERRLAALAEATRGKFKGTAE